MVKEFNLAGHAVAKVFGLAPSGRIARYRARWVRPTMPSGFARLAACGSIGITRFIATLPVIHHADAEQEP
jgi:hypothetical protein